MHVLASIIYMPKRRSITTASGLELVSIRPVVEIVVAVEIAEVAAMAVGIAEVAAMAVEENNQ